MTKKKQFKKGYLLQMLLAFMLWTTSQTITAQTGVSLSWNKEVGCQVYDVERKKEGEFYVEDIEPGVCLRFCENTTVIYTLNGLPTNPVTTWFVSGGTVISQNMTSITVQWGAIGNGTLEYTTEISPEETVTQLVCVEIIGLPEALFTVFPAAPNEPLYGCVDQSIYFTNLSTAGNGSDLVSYYWDFGDGTFSSAENPVHTFSYSDTFTVVLTVTNACNCTDYHKMDIKIGETSEIEILCPSVVCEGQSDTYSLPEDIVNSCGGFKWSVIGGQIVGSNAEPTVTVIWDNVDESGFGYVTFDPSDCDLPCSVPVTIKVPVIQTIGTIQGNTELCVGQQGRFTLPQWPTTDFTWEILGNSGNSLAQVIPTDQRNEVIITPFQAGTITLYATYYNTLLKCGGTATLTINVGQNEPFSGPSSVCLDSNVTYATISNNSVNWILRNSSGVVISTLNNANSFNHTFATVGNFELTVSGPGICASGQTRFIQVLPALTPATLLPYSTEVCIDSPYTFEINNPDSNSEYHWSVVNGTPLGATTGTSFTASFSSNGQVLVTRERLSPAGCSSTEASFPVNILEIDAEITNSAINAPVVSMSACSNNYFEYKAINNNGATGLYNDPESTFTWSIIPQSAGSITSGQGTNTVEVLWNNVTQVETPTLSLVINKCTVSKTINQIVTVSPIPEITINGNNSVCSGADITFTVSPSTPLAPNTIINWSFSDGQQINGPAGQLSIDASFNNGIGNNLDFTVSASITNPNGCVTTIVASKNFVVTPGPNANNSLASGGNVFCLASEIQTIFTATTSTGASIQWYKNNVSNPLAGETSGTLVVNGTTNYGFGLYFFVATLNGCSTTSNSLRVVQRCGPPPTCVVTPAPTTSLGFNQNCGSINLTGFASAGYLYTNWSLLGPGPDVGFVDQPSNNGTNQYSYNAIKAGIYHFFFNVYYNGANNQICKFTEMRVITVNYVPFMEINAVCSNNNVFNVELNDNSDYMPNVTNKQYKYEIGTSPTGPFTLLNNWSSNATHNITNQAAGSYYIRHSIRGQVNGVTQTECSVVVPLELDTITVSAIDFEQPLCYDQTTDFNIPFAPTDYTYIWTFDGGVQNTNPEPSRVFDPSLAGTSVPISVTIKNKWGCEKTINATVNIPARCYFGDALASSLTACVGDTIEISYDLGAAECAPAMYQLLNGTQVAATSSTNSFMVGQPGFYTVRVINGNGCIYETPNIITPYFVPAPTLNLSSPSLVCQGSSASMTVTTSADEIRWEINNVAQPAYDDMTSIPLSGFAIGTHSVTVTVTDSATGCTKSKSTTFTVVASPSNPWISAPVVLNCDTYEIELTASSSEVGTFSWSNGETGPTIVVTAGGPYMVTFTNAAGCKSYAQIDVPKSPEAYMWIFPTGCYEICRENFGSLIGPNAFMNQWSWNLEGNADAGGTNNYPTPYQIGQSGAYTMTLNNGLCDFESEPLSIQDMECRPCPIKDIRIVSIKLDDRARERGLCWFTYELLITNSLPVDMELTFSDPGQDILLSPATIIAMPGTHLYTVTVIPVNGYNGGTVSLEILGSFVDGRRTIYCYYYLDLPVEDCSQYVSRQAESGATESNSLNTPKDLLIYPNPAKDQVHIQYESTAKQTTLEIYDLTGRLIAKHSTTEAKGVWTVDMQWMSAGIYVVVLKEDNQLITQKKLQIL